MTDHFKPDRSSRSVPHVVALRTRPSARRWHCSKTRPCWGADQERQNTPASTEVEAGVFARSGLDRHHAGARADGHLGVIDQPQ